MYKDKIYEVSEIDNLKSSFQDLVVYLFISLYIAIFFNMFENSFILTANEFEIYYTSYTNIIDISTYDYIRNLILDSSFILVFCFSMIIIKKKGLNYKKENAYKEFQEKRNLEQEFKVILDKNPASTKECIDIFMSIYGVTYPENIDKLKRLLFISKKTTSDEIEEATKSYFKSIIFEKDNFKSLHGSEPIYNLELIHKFAKKYGHDYNESDLQSLNKLLLQAGIKFHDIELLKSLISYSVFDQGYDTFVEKMLSSNPSNEIEYIEQYIRVCKDTKEVNMRYFYLLLSSLNMTDLSFEEFKEYMDTKIFGMKLISDANKKLTINNVDKMNGYEFENFIGSLYEKMGYTVEQTSKSGDQGADLIITKFGERSAVQTKNYTGNVSNKAIQEVVASQEFYKCTSSSVVTNSYFTKSAMELGNVNGVKLVDREELKVLIDKYM